MESQEVAAKCGNTEVSLTETNTDVNTDTNTVTYTYTNTDADMNRYTNTDTYTDSNSNANTDINKDTNTDKNTHTNTNTITDKDTDFHSTSLHMSVLHRKLTNQTECEMTAMTQETGYVGQSDTGGGGRYNTGQYPRPGLNLLHQQVSESASSFGI